MICVSLLFGRNVVPDVDAGNRIGIVQLLLSRNEGCESKSEQFVHQKSQKVILWREHRRKMVWKKKKKKGKKNSGLKKQKRIQKNDRQIIINS
jgi:hypothetical protein